MYVEVDISSGLAELKKKYTEGGNERMDFS